MEQFAPEFELKQFLEHLQESVMATDDHEAEAASMKEALGMGPDKAKFSHYRRSKTTKAPRKRTFIAHMTKYSQADTASLESAARGVGRDQAGGHGSAKHVDPNMVPVAGPPEGNLGLAGTFWSSAPAMSLSTAASSTPMMMQELAAALIGSESNTLNSAQTLRNPSSLLSLLQASANNNKEASDNVTGPGLMSPGNSLVRPLETANSLSEMSGNASNNTAKVSFDMFPELAALAGGQTDNYGMEPVSYRSACNSRAVLTSVDYHAPYKVAGGARPSAEPLTAAPSTSLSSGGSPAVSAGSPVVTAEENSKPARSTAAAVAASLVPATGAQTIASNMEVVQPAQSVSQKPTESGNNNSSASKMTNSMSATNTTVTHGPAALFQQHMMFQNQALLAAAMRNTNAQQMMAGILPMGVNAGSNTLGAAAAFMGGNALPAGWAAHSVNMQPVANAAATATTALRKRGRRPRNAASVPQLQAPGQQLLQKLTGANSGDMSGSTADVLPLHGMSEAGAVVPGSAGCVRLSRLVSAGAYGLVYRGVWSGRDVAVKIMRTPGPSEILSAKDVLASFRRESELLRKLAHPNIVALQHAQDVAPVCLVQDYAVHGTLSSYIHSAKPAAGSLAGAPTELERATLTRLARRLAMTPEKLISELELRGFAGKHAAAGGVAHGSLRRYVVLLCMLRDVASALVYLSAPPPSTRLPAVVHRDVKPANILLTAQGTAQLADFGVAHILAVAAPLPAAAPAANSAADMVTAVSDMYSAWHCDVVSAFDIPEPATKRVRSAPTELPAGLEGIAAAAKAAANTNINPAASMKPVAQQIQLPAAVDILPSVDMDLSWLNTFLNDDHDDPDLAGLSGGRAADNAAAASSGSSPSPTPSPAMETDYGVGTNAGANLLPSKTSSTTSSSITCGSVNTGNAAHADDATTLQLGYAKPTSNVTTVNTSTSMAKYTPTNDVDMKMMDYSSAVAPPLPRHGTAHYAAPEDLKPTTYALTTAADVFSWGCCAWEALSGMRPWGSATSADVVSMVGLQGGRLPLPDAWPARMRSLLSACWAVNPASRPAPAELLLELDSEIRTALHG